MADFAYYLVVGSPYPMDDYDQQFPYTQEGLHNAIAFAKLVQVDEYALEYDPSFKVSIRIIHSAELLVIEPKVKLSYQMAV